MNPAVKYTGRIKHSAKAMMLGVVGSDEGSLNANFYDTIMSMKVFPMLDATYDIGKWVWTQDVAPCHSGKAAQQYLLTKLGSKGFRLKKLAFQFSTPESLGLLFVSRPRMVATESKVCASYHYSVEAMTCMVATEWSNMSTETLKTVCLRFRTRLKACIAAKGMIFEK